jgi:hypothetical protein
MIKDRSYDRAVEVTVIYPEGVNVTNVQELAEKAWRSVNKEIKIGKVTVKVRAFTVLDNTVWGRSYQSGGNTHVLSRPFKVLDCLLRNPLSHQRKRG